MRSPGGPGTIIEACAAALGAALLIVVLAVAFLAHAWRGQLPGALLVYAAGALLVGLQTPAPARRELS